MKQKSLRQLARELGVSASYLSQVRNGKKKPSKNLLSKLDIKVLTNVNQHPLDTHLADNYNTFCAEVAQSVEQRTENELPNSKLFTNYDLLLTEFLDSRRQGLSPRTIGFYKGYLFRSKQVLSPATNGQHITYFLKSLKCTAGGKHAYYRALKAFYNWLYSPKSGYKLNAQNNPVLNIDPPKLDRKILPSLTLQQLNYLIEQANCIRDKSIISLFADSGLRLSELANIDPQNIDWEHKLIKVNCKGNKEGLAIFIVDCTPEVGQVGLGGFGRLLPVPAD